MKQIVLSLFILGSLLSSSKAQSTSAADLIREMSQNYQNTSLDSQNITEQKIRLITIVKNLEMIQQISVNQKEQPESERIMAEELDLDHIIGLEKVSEVFSKPKSVKEMVSKICSYKEKDEQQIIKKETKVKCR